MSEVIRVNGTYESSTGEKIIYAKQVNILQVIVNLFRFNRTNWKAVSGCFFAAAVFWLFNALNKNYATNVRFPLKFEFDRTRFVPATTLPPSIYLNVSGNGWILFRKVIGVKLPAIVIPLERPADVKKIVGSTMPPLLSGQIGNLKINHVVTDTLYLNIEQRDSGRYKLAVDVSGISYKKGYGRISPIVVLPDSILLEGPKSAFHHLSDSLTLVLPEQKLSGNYRDEIEVVVPGDGFMKRNPPVVEVMFEVGEIIVQEKRIKLKLVNVDPKISFTEEGDSINVVFQIPGNRQQEFSQLKNLSGLLDVKHLKRGVHKILPQVSGMPRYAVVDRIDSIRIKLY